ncbi:STE24 endopeptidase [Lampropedia hyalina DSM 16112]|uniref:STE24 endopeptidase n=2 Tax=Lampropedia TaxID=198705 RepID=A0A1M5AKC9_9BURK|nr:STE24 endopeptidase [Lampropedia hyalina DSM 16112]
MVGMSWDAMPLASGLAWTWLALVLLHGLIEAVLALRQMRHVRQHRGAVPAAFRSHIALAAHQKAADYTVATVRLGLWELLWSAALLLFWTLGGGLDALNAALRQAMGTGLAQQIALVLVFAGISMLLALPWGWYKTFRIEQGFGFNRMRLGLWLMDTGRSLLLGLLLGAPLAAAVLWLIHSAGSAWPLAAWLLWMGFNALVMWLFPTVIAPLFNRFQPLQDPVLQQRVETLMQRSGFAAKGLFVMDGSRRSAHANAYFTGWGTAKRVVFFDTLLQKLNADEVEAVLAHELGHFKHRHIAKRMLSMGLLSLLGLAMLGWLMQQPWFFAGMGIHVQGDNAQVLAHPQALGLLLFALMAGVLGGLMQPLGAFWSRKHEFEADAYAMRQTEGRHLASALLKLYQDNAATLTPDPWYARFHYSHPPATERLARMQPQATGATT